MEVADASDSSIPEVAEAPELLLVLTLSAPPPENVAVILRELTVAPRGLAVYPVSVPGTKGGDMVMGVFEFVLITRAVTTGFVRVIE
jgi:hypothetical protein